MSEFDIERFPTSESAKRMVSRVSPIYYRSYIGKWLFEVMGLELDEARMLIRSLRDQCYAERCSWGMRYWEERYGIEVDTDKDLEERRAAVLAKRGAKRPLSPAAIEDILRALTGREVSIVEAGLSFTVVIEEGDSPVDYTAVIERLDKIKPSHLAYRIELPRRGTMQLYVAAALHEFKTIIVTEYDRSGVLDIVWYTDEVGDTLIDESENILVE